MTKRNGILLFAAAIALLLLFPAGYKSATPQDGAEERQRAIAQYYQGDLAGCRQTLRDLVAAFPDNADYRADLIRVLREMGDYDEAIEQLLALSARNPADSDIRAELIQLHYLAGRPGEAARLAETADLSASGLYWRGLALAELGREKEAAKALNDSLAKEGFNPLAYYRLGQLAQQAGDFAGAVSLYKKAAAQEPNLTMVYYPLAQCYLSLENYPSAHSMLANARAFYAYDREIAAAWRKFTAEHPEILERQQVETRRKRQVLTPPRVEPIAADRDKIPKIRIGLVEKVGRFYLKTGGRFRLSAPPGGQSYSGAGQTVLCVVRGSKGIEFRTERGALLFAAGSNATLTYEDPAATTILFDVEYGPGSFWAGREDRVYRGDFQFLRRDGGLTIVNRLNVEEYLYGVVPAEMEPTWPLEALKAQAVAARTYAFANLGSYEARGFDLLATVASQVYRGVRIERSSTNAAVSATRGRILRYNGKPIGAFYSANNGGYSTASRDIWGFDAPYLQAVPDKALPHAGPFSPAQLAAWLTSRPRTHSNHPQYSGRSQYRWTAWVSRSDLENRLNLGDRLGRIQAVFVSGRSVNGAATRVTIRGTAGEHTVKGDAIRSKLGGLRSNVFVVEPKLDADGVVEGFYFYGGGWGHGVGMCQSGAAGMAAAGHDYAEILAHYYPGAELAALYE